MKPAPPVTRTRMVRFLEEGPRVEYDARRPRLKDGEQLCAIL